MNTYNTNPTVSIVIPVYNGSDYLREAIDSALAQTFNDFEVIVVNDGSSDGGKTEKIAHSYGPAIRYFVKENGGVASALNVGVREMRGKYFSWLSHDDVFYPDKITAQMSFLASNNNAADTILYGDFDIINSASECTDSIKIDAPKPGQMRFALTVGYPIHGCTTLIPRSCFEKGGLFDEKLRTTQDYDLWFRFAGLFPFVHQAKPLIKSRHHEAQGTVTMNRLHMREVDELLGRFLHSLKVEELLEITGRPLPYSYMQLADSFLTRGFLSSTNSAVGCSLKAFDTLSVGEKIRLLVRLFLIEIKRSSYAILRRI